MIPFFETPDIHIGPLTLHPFGALAAIAMLLGIRLAQWRARTLNVDETELNALLGWVIAGGLAGAHILERLLYHPAELAERPWSLLFFWDGLSSMGGFVGATIAALLWKRIRGGNRPLLPLADIILSILPVPWILARLGCALVHDHPGRPTSATNWLAVAYPDGPRYDLGLLEMLLAVVLSLIVAMNWHRPRPLGWYVAVVSLTYAPVRFALDFLRAIDIDPRYAGLTPAQWACIPLFIFGVYVAMRRAMSGIAPQWHPRKPLDRSRD